MSANLRRFVEVGDSATSDVANTRRAEVSVDPYVDENGYVQNAGFVQQPIAALEKRDMTGPVAIVLHRTDGASVESAVNSAKSGIGIHFYVGKDGTVYQTASLLLDQVEAQRLGDEPRSRTGLAEERGYRAGVGRPVSVIMPVTAWPAAAYLSLGRAEHPAPQR